MGAAARRKNEPLGIGSWTDRDEKGQKYRQGTEQRGRIKKWAQHDGWREIKKGKSNGLCSRKGGIETLGWEAVRCRGCMGFKGRDREMEKERQRRKQNHIHRAGKEETEPRDKESQKN